MSATNRGSQRENNDFYPTPAYCIQDFLDAFLICEPIADATAIKVLDPCCGLQPYAAELRLRGFSKIWNVDICQDAKADCVSDYLNYAVPFKPDFIVSNPPYNLARQFVEKAMKDGAEGCMIAFLLRINFFGSQNRKPFFDIFQPKYAFVHSKRPSFKKGGTDATEYAHFVWQIGYNQQYTKLFVL